MLLYGGGLGATGRCEIRIVTTDTTAATSACHCRRCLGMGMGSVLRRMRNDVSIWQTN
jgi:hypothetical protein